MISTHRVFATLLLLTTLSGCSVFSSDPGHRTPGVVIDDAVLENLVEQEIRKSDSGYKGSHLVIVAYNGLVLIAGQVASPELKAKASEVTQELRRVRKVHNELSTAWVSGC